MSVWQRGAPVSIRRIDTLLFLASLIVLVIQAFTGSAWQVALFAVLLAGAILAPSRWTVGRKNTKVTP